MNGFLSLYILMYKVQARMNNYDKMIKDNSLKKMRINRNN